MAKPRSQGTDFKPHAGIQRARQLWYDSLDRAEQGDPKFAKLVFDRLFPTIKPVEAPISFKMPKGLTTDQRLEHLEAALFEGEVSREEVERLLDGLYKIQKAREILVLADSLDDMDPDDEQSS